jgi:hypothetical protein
VTVLWCVENKGGKGAGTQAHESVTLSVAGRWPGTPHSGGTVVCCVGWFCRGRKEGGAEG